MISIEDLSFRYRRRATLFDQLSLNLPAGNIYGLLGKNGAGKSTLLKIMSGVLFPDQGKLDVVGFDPQDRFPGFLSEIYLVTEEFELPSMKLNRFIKLYAPFYPRFNYEALDSYLAEFQLNPNQNLKSLSYGQKKKFLLCFGLATDCKLLILDEPTNGLDIPSKSQFRKVVASAINEERSFIISTHQVRDMENLIDPIIILDEGEVVLCESLEHISQKLVIEKQKEVSDDDNLIYAEPGLGGYTVVKKNTLGEETNVSLETLFSAAVSNKEKFHEIFDTRHAAIL